MIKGLESIANFTWPSALSDKAWTAVLKDTEFLDGYISLNTKRLGETYVRCTEILKTHGIKYQGQGFAPPLLRSPVASG